MFFRRENVYSQLEQVFDSLRDRLVQEQQTIVQPFMSGPVQQITPYAQVRQGIHNLEIPQNEDVFPQSSRSITRDLFPDRSISLG